MATDPERDIEKALRAAARRRREQPGAPAEVHPATRRLLQAAVSREKGRGRSSPSLWAKLLWGSWPRFALSVSLFIALLVAATVWILPTISSGPSTGTFARMDYAKDQRAKVDSLALRDDYKKSVPSAAPALKQEAQNEPGSAADFDQIGKDKVYNRVGPAAQAKVAELPPTNSPGLQADATAAAAAPTQPATPPPAVAASSSATPALDQEFARRQVASAPAVVSQKFTRVNPPADSANSISYAQTSPVPRVLDSFRVEQSGSQLRVIDSDGSVYTGVLGQTNFVAEDSLARKDAAGESGQLAGAKQNEQDGAQAPSGAVASKKLPESPPAQPYFFRVSGTNISLNQPVVLTGNFFQTAANARGSGGRGGAAPGQSLNRAAAAAVGGALQPAATNGPVPLPLSNLRLQGHALVGTNQIEITAQPDKK